MLNLTELLFFIFLVFEPPLRVLLQAVFDLVLLFTLSIALRPPTFGSFSLFSKPS